MIKTILVPTDGSDHADKAVMFASDLASKYDARIVFLHVFLSDATPANIRSVIDTQKLSKSAREELERFDEMQMKIFAAAGAATAFVPVSISVSGEVLHAVGNVVLDDAESVAKEHGAKKIDRLLAQGDPAKSILSSADEEKADMIVMGARGLNDLEGLLMGSASHKVSHLAQCTCVTVK